jgi:uncharacterized iron-regulated membrane protein
MTKFLNKWTRILHRWLAIPTIIIIPLAVISKFAGDSTQHLPPQIEQLQSILMLLLVITGSYLYLIPYLARWQRNRRAAARATAPTARTRTPERVPEPAAVPLTLYPPDNREPGNP